MSGDSITVNAGGPDIADGTYPMQLIAFEGPRTFVPERGVNAGKDVAVFDWTWRTKNHNGVELDLEETSSTNTGPRSKAYEWLTALLGQPPAVGMTITAEQLVGRWVYGQILRDPPETGWPKLVATMPMPAQALQQQFGQATGAPTAPAAPVSPLRAPEPPPADPAGTFVMPPPVQVPQSQPAGPLPNQAPVQDDLPF